MEAPKCKLCGSRHLLNESHVFKSSKLPETLTSQDARQVKQHIADRLNRVQPQAQVSVSNIKIKHCDTCRCFPSTNAERQRAYRERHKANHAR